LKQDLEKFANMLEQFIDWTGRTVSWLVLAMVLITSAVVLFRYLFDTGWIALQESVSYLHSIVFMIGAAYTLKQNAHVRVDIFYSRLGEAGKAWIDLTGHLLILLPVMLFIIWISWPYVSDSWQIQESSREAGGLPGIYLLKSLIIIMAALLIVQSIALMFRALLSIMYKAKTGKQAGESA